MGSSAVWVVVECACRILGISTAAVLCAVGAETLRQGEFHSLAVYLLISAGGMMLFEVAYFIDVLLVMCLPCPPTWKVFIVWRKMARTGGFQKFLYYTMMSVVCFLHPVLVWHAVIPGIMLLVTGFLNFILSKKKKAEQPKETRDAYSDSAFSSVCVNDTGDTEQVFSFFHMMASRRSSFLPSNSRLQSPLGCSQAMLQRHHPANTSDRLKQSDGRHVRFIDSAPDADHDETEMEEYHAMEPEETTSDKAPMIRP